MQLAWRRGFEAGRRAQEAVMEDSLKELMNKLLILVNLLNSEVDEGTRDVKGE